MLGDISTPALLVSIRASVQRFGIALMRSNDVEHEAATVDAAEFVATLTAAEARREKAVVVTHMRQMIEGIARSAAERTGPVRVSYAAWLLIRSYAVTGAVPAREDDAPLKRKVRR